MTESRKQKIRKRKIQSILRIAKRKQLESRTLRQTNGDNIFENDDEDFDWRERWSKAAKKRLATA